MSESKPSKLHLKIVELLRAHPDGLTEGEMRSLLEIPSERQVQFGRRRRELHSFFQMEKSRRGSDTVYKLLGEAATPKDAVAISQKLRAELIIAAHGRCQMCGRSINEHGVRLVIDHKVPRDWGGKTEPENLWAICDECNAGKKNFYASVDSPAVRQAMTSKSPHIRIGELLKAFGIGTEVPARLIQFVADQDQWDKRLRELRYLGWKIKARTRNNPSGRKESFYILEEFKEWIPNPSKWIQEYEKKRKRRNRANKKLRK